LLKRTWEYSHGSEARVKLRWPSERKKKMRYRRKKLFNDEGRRMAKEERERER